ncbi:TatD family hydrolase [Marinobacterium rhizophilum]|uniref:TatD family hydrolase n=1 Tax=Marinobacterium rhizophilum TaxID=420402 RepID=UPI0003A0A0EF|nr:TatD family hydrolase [Marinobacterium rhizophilum]
MLDPMTDIGANLTDKRFAHDLDAVLARASAAGVSTLIVTGTSAAGSDDARSLCERHPGQLYFTAGIHPHHASDYCSDSHVRLRHLARHRACVAIGETGLDFNRNFSSPAQQVAAFEQQLELASETGLPLFLHERDAHAQQLAMLKSHRNTISRAVAHCFTGTADELYGYLELDLYIGLTGWICDERRGGHLLDLIKDIPADRLLLETDAPYLLPRDLRPKPKSGRNEPCYLPHIAERVAKATGESIEALRARLHSNSQTFFALQPDQAGH